MTFLSRKKTTDFCRMNFPELELFIAVDIVDVKGVRHNLKVNINPLVIG